GFYDSVQTGQLISRANSDIRSVQMYLTFAPAIIVQCSVAVVASSTGTCRSARFSPSAPTS
ncbi:MAG: hypothetical protein M3Z06_16660, partial [Actinomycetota bacterium]|nr:hypothetical protein [Actinomycetota bacterium]